MLKDAQVSYLPLGANYIREHCFFTFIHASFPVKSRAEVGVDAQHFLFIDNLGQSLYFGYQVYVLFVLPLDVWQEHTGQ